MDFDHFETARLGFLCSFSFVIGLVQRDAEADMFCFIDTWNYGIGASCGLYCYLDFVSLWMDGNL